MKLKYKDEKQVFNEIEKNGVLYLEFPILAEPGVVRHGISTRLGGVSEGIYSSMNLSFTRGDSEENVRENYRRIGKALGVREENMVCSVQTLSLIHI